MNSEQKPMNKKEKQHIGHMIIGQSAHFTLEHRLFNLTSFLTVVFSAFALVMCFILKLSDIAKWIVVIATVVLSIFYYISRFKKNYRNVIWPFYFFTMILLAVDWFIRAGSYGHSNFVYMVFVFYIMVVIPKHQSAVAIIISLLFPAGLMITEYLHPEWVQYYELRSTRFIDVIVEYTVLLLFMAVGALLVINNFRSERQTVEEKNSALRTINRELMSSIRYASMIQRSILPDINQIKQYLDQIEILFKPRDIVGGDFYWFHPFENHFLIAVADCTGHGVPGALMSMTASSILNQVVNDYCNDDPAKILSHLNRIMKTNLGYDGNATYSDDGLDIGMCLIRSDRKKLIYSGASISIFVQDQNELSVIKGDSQSIGYKDTSLNFEFHNHNLDIEPGQRIFLFSDGIAHLVGGEKNLPFGYQNLQDLIIHNNRLELTELYREINQRLGAYQGDEPQRDDMTLIAIEI